MRPAILGTIASVLLTLGWAGSAGAVVPGQNGKIAFVGKDGDEEIYTVSPDGLGLTALTSNAVSDGAPAWSPDGRSIAFVSFRDGNYEIYVMGADGTNPTRLTDDAGYDLNPAWSPDGQRIAFTSDRDGDSEIYVMGADGSSPTHLTTNTAYDDEAAWSPDGAKIAFASNRAPYGPDGELYVMDADGSNQTHLTDNSLADSDPAWSPDSQRIAFARNRAGFVLDYDIHVMDADGSHQAPVTTDHGFNRMPAWSPDGRKITFNGSRADGQRVRIVNADGSAETTVTTAPPTTSESDPDWQAPPIVPPQAAQPAGAQHVPASSPGPVMADRRPLSRIALKARVVPARSWRTIAGTATDDHAIRRVQLSVVRRRVTAGQLRCKALNARARWLTYRPAGRSCGPQFLLAARGTTKWSLRLRRHLPAGRYAITSRATDGAGQRETGFSTALGNRRNVRAR
jgi:dipeptidyl aminopeptidase/acylaminoacyl peptidase